MDQVKHSITVEDGGQRYRAPETKVIFVKTWSVLCSTHGNEPMNEKDFGGGGFETGY